MMMKRSAAALLVLLLASVGSAAVTLTSIEPASVPTHQLSIVTLSGSGFEMLSSVEPSSALCETLSSESIVCLFEDQAAGTIPVSVAGSDAIPLTFFPGAFVTGIEPPFLPTSGGIVTISGGNFQTDTGAPNLVMVGEKFPCNIQSISQDQIVCELAPGAGRDLNVEIRFGVHFTAPNSFFSYEAPVVTSVEPNVAPPGAVVIIHGSNFGPASVAADNEIVATIGGHPCNFIVWHGDSAIQCEVPNGAGANVRVDVVVAGQASVVEEYASFSESDGSSSVQVSRTGLFRGFTFEPPRVDTIDPTEGPAEGGTLVTVFGAHFGEIPDPEFAVFIGDTPCVSPEIGYVSSHIAQCVTPPFPGGDSACFPVYVAIGEQRSARNEDATFCYTDAVVNCPGTLPDPIFAFGAESALLGPQPVDTTNQVTLSGFTAGGVGVSGSASASVRSREDDLDFFVPVPDVDFAMVTPLLTKVWQERPVLSLFAAFSSGGISKMAPGQVPIFTISYLTGTQTATCEPNANSATCQTSVELPNEWFDSASSIPGSVTVTVGDVTSEPTAFSLIPADDFPTPAEVTMFLIMPQRDVVEGTTFEASLYAYSPNPGTLVENLDVQIDFPLSVEVDSVNPATFDGGNPRYAGSEGIFNDVGRLNLAWTRAVAYTHGPGDVHIANVVFRVKETPSDVESSPFTLFINEMNDQNNGGLVASDPGAVFPPTVTLLDDIPVAFYQVSATTDIFSVSNVAELADDAFVPPVTVLTYVAVRSGNTNPVAPTACALNTEATTAPGVTIDVETDGCVYNLAGPISGPVSPIVDIPGYPAGSLPSRMVNIRVWLLDAGSVALESPDTNLDRVKNFYLDEGCTAPGFQRSVVRASGSFVSSTGNPHPARLDLTQFIKDRNLFRALAISSPEILSVDAQGTVWAEAFGDATESTVSFRGSSASVTFTLVGTEEEAEGIIPELDVIIATGVDITKTPSEYGLLDSSTLSASYLQELNFEGDTADIAVFARYPDGNIYEVTDSVILTADEPEAATVDGPVLTAHTSFCGKLVTAVWPGCGDSVATGRGRAAITLPEPTGVRVEIASNIVHPGSDAEVAGFDSSADVRVFLIFPDREVDFTKDPRTNYDAITANADGLYDLVIERDGDDEILNVRVVGSGNGLAGVAGLIVSFDHVDVSTNADVTVAIAASYNLVTISWPNYEDIPSTMEPKSTISLIDCTNAFQRLEIGYQIVLTDARVGDISGHDNTVFSPDVDGVSFTLDGAGYILVTEAPDLDVEASGQLSANFNGSPLSDMSVPLTVSPVVVPITETIFDFPGTFSGIVGATRRVLTDAFFADGTAIRDAEINNMDLDLYDFVSDSPAEVTIDADGVATLLDNNKDSSPAVEFAVTTSCTSFAGSVTTIPNLVPIPGDVDIGSQDGSPIPSLNAGDRFSLPVRVNSGAAAIGAFNLVVFFDESALSPIADAPVQVGADWPGGQFESTVRNPFGQVTILGTLGPSADLSGNGVEIAVITFDVLRDDVVVALEVNIVDLLDDSQSPERIGDTVNSVASSTVYVPQALASLSRSGAKVASGDVAARAVHHSASVAAYMDSASSRRRDDHNGCAPGEVRGDTNYDCVFTIADVKYVTDFLAGLPVTPADPGALDGTRDGTVSIADATFFIRVLALKFRFFDLDIQLPTAAEQPIRFIIASYDDKGVKSTAQVEWSLALFFGENDDMRYDLGKPALPEANGVGDLSFGLVVDGPVHAATLVDFTDEENIDVVVFTRTFDQSGGTDGNSFTQFHLTPDGFSPFTSFFLSLAGETIPATESVGASQSLGQSASLAQSQSLGATVAQSPSQTEEADTQSQSPSDDDFVSTETAEPEDPTQSRDPEAPTESRDPSIPTESRDPSIPTESRDPSIPTESRDPSIPTESRDPSIPTESRDPSIPTESRDPSIPTESRDPSIPTESRDPSIPTESRDPSIPTESRDPSIPTESRDPSIPTETRDPSIPTETAIAGETESQSASPASGPKLRTAQFSNDGFSINVGFDVATRRGTSTSASSGSIACSLVFDTATIDTFGTAPTCRFTSSSTIEISLGDEATVQTGSGITMSPTNTIYKLESSNPVPATGTAIVAAPANPPKPTVVLSSPSAIAFCVAVNIDAHGSLGGAGRDFTSVLWTLDSASPAISAGELEAIQESLLESSTNGDLELIVHEDLLPNDVTYTFSLTVVNFLGGIGTKTKAIFKSSEALPTVFIDGDSEITQLAAESTSLSGRAQLPSCSASTALFFEWTVISTPTFTLNAVTRTTRSLSINKNTMEVGVTYTLSLEACDSLDVCSSSTVDITAVASPLRAAVTGGSRFSGGTVSGFSIDASPSSDPDNLDADMLYSLECFIKGTDTPCPGVDLPTGTTDSHIDVSGGILGVGTYTIQVDVEKTFSNSLGTEIHRSDDVSVEVQIVEGSPPSAKILPLSVDRPAAGNDLQFVASASSPTGSAMAYSWSLVIPEDFENFDSDDVSLNRDTTHLFVFANALSANTEYVLRFEAQHVGGLEEVGFSELDFLTNRPPFGGKLTVTPATGFAFDDFVARASTWTTYDDNLPLKYQFTYKRDPSSTSPATIATRTTVATSATMVLSSGLGVDSAMTVSVTIIDRYDQRTVKSATITVEPRSTSRRGTNEDDIAFVDEYMTNDVQSSVDVGDYDRMTQQIISSMNLLDEAEAAACVEDGAADSHARVLGLEFLDIKDANVEHSNALEDLSNFQAYESVLSTEYLPNEAIEAARASLLTLADETAIVGKVEPQTGHVLALIFDHLVESLRHCGDDSGLHEIVTDGVETIRHLGRTALGNLICGAPAFKAVSADFQNAFQVVCPDIIKPLSIASEGSSISGSLTLSSSVLNGNFVRVLMSKLQDSRFDGVDERLSEILSIEIETDDDTNTPVDVSDLSGSDRVRIAIPRTDGGATANEGLTCGFYDESQTNVALVDDGSCELDADATTSELVVCYCEHLTDFAALIQDSTPSPSAPAQSDDDDDTTGGDDDDDGPGGGGNVLGDGSLVGSDTGAAIGGSLGAIGAICLIIGVSVLLLRRRRANRLAPHGAGSDDAPPPAAAGAWDEDEDDAPGMADSSNPPLRTGAGGVPAVDGADADPDADAGADAAPDADADADADANADAAPDADAPENGSDDEARPADE